MEQWKPISGTSFLYWVSTKGNVIRRAYTVFSTGRWGKARIHRKELILKNILASKKSYYRVAINGKLKSIHRLVADAFIPNPSKKPQVNHKDGNKLNNCVENLEWATASENSTHSTRMGLQNHVHMMGEKNKMSKLTSKQVIEIKKQLNSGITAYSIAKKLNIPYGTIRDVKFNKTWKHLKE